MAVPLVVVLFFKQKTAYERRISDWISDVCSSALAIGDIGERLGREYHRDVLLAQRLQPFADARGEQRVVEEDPGFVEDQQRRPSVEPLFEPMEQVGEHEIGRAHV